MDINPLDLRSTDIQMEGIPHLEVRFSALIDAVERSHPGDILDESKNFLECILRTIAIDVQGEERRIEIERLHMPELSTRAAECVLLSDDTNVHMQVSELCQELVRRIARLRNSHGASSHGRDGYHEDQLGYREALFVAQSSVAVGSLFFSRHQGRSDTHKNKRIQYVDNPEFNEYLDQMDDVIVAGVAMLPSKALFYVDSEGYKAALVDYIERREIDST